MSSGIPRLYQPTPNTISHFSLRDATDEWCVLLSLKKKNQNKTFGRGQKCVNYYTYT